jgi:hypothetical protein
MFPLKNAQGEENEELSFDRRNRGVVADHVGAGTGRAAEGGGRAPPSLAAQETPLRHAHASPLGHELQDVGKLLIPVIKDAALVGGVFRSGSAFARTHPAAWGVAAATRRATHFRLSEVARNVQSFSQKYFPFRKTEVMI